jgi:hypothetical protein
MNSEDIHMDTLLMSRVQIREGDDIQVETYLSEDNRVWRVRTFRWIHCLLAE